MKMLTTKQVRKIMHSFEVPSINMWTNKTLGHKGQNRRVKCYSTELSVFVALQRACGAANVKATQGCNPRGSGIVVKCLID